MVELWNFDFSLISVYCQSGALSFKPLRVLKSDFQQVCSGSRNINVTMHVSDNLMNKRRNYGPFLHFNALGCVELHVFNFHFLGRYNVLNKFCMWSDFENLSFFQGNTKSPGYRARVTHGVIC